MSPSHPAPQACCITPTTALREIKRTQEHTNSNRLSCRHNSGMDPCCPHSLRLAPLQTLPSSLDELFPVPSRSRRSLRNQSTQTRLLTHCRMQLTLRGPHQCHEVTGTGGLALLCVCCASRWGASRFKGASQQSHTPKNTTHSSTRKGYEFR